MKRRMLLVMACVVYVTLGGATASGAHETIPDPTPDGALGARVGHDQHGAPDGHLPASAENVQLVGKLRVHDAAPGIIADVGELGNYAYLAQFAPGCETDGAGGVYIVDITDPAHPREAGFIRAHQGSYVGEGVHAIHIDTTAFTGDILAHNNEICGEGGLGGVSLWDITTPDHPRPLAQNFGDTRDASGNTVPVRQYHSVFAWQQGDRAYLVGSDDEEQGTTDVDIMDITDPRHPKLVAETGLADWPAAQRPLANGDTVFNHDMVVRKLGNTWTMLVSYWDAGYVELNVNDPADPRFIRDSDFTDPDPVTGDSPPEGNGHYAEFDRTGRFAIGTDEDFSPYRTRFELTTGPNAGVYPAGEFGFTQPIASLPDEKLNGPTVYGGYACDDDLPAIPPASSLGLLAPGEEAILVVQRGPLEDPNHPHDPCRFDEKIQNAADAGYGGVIVAQHHVGSGAGAYPDAFTCGGGEPRPIAAICIGHRTFHLMFNRTPAYGVPYPAGDPGDLEPDPGNVGPRVQAQPKFDGWGYIHLFDSRTLKELDVYAIPEEEDPAFATGFGNLTVHEVTFDPTADLAYLSWYAAGFRVVTYADGTLREVGHFIDQGGNDFWGVQIHRTAAGEVLILASDRDSGLYIFRYGPTLDICSDTSSSPANPPPGYNVIVGTGGDDALLGTPGRDAIFGLGGHDRISGAAGDDVVFGGDGNDQLMGADGSDTLCGGHGDDSLDGDVGSDALDGGEGTDALLGGPGDDTLRGGPGHDRLDGGPGTNTNDGGDDLDLCLNGTGTNCSP